MCTKTNSTINEETGMVNIAKMHRFILLLLILLTEIQRYAIITQSVFFLLALGFPCGVVNQWPRLLTLSILIKKMYLNSETYRTEYKKDKAKVTKSRTLAISSEWSYMGGEAEPGRQKQAGSRRKSNSESKIPNSHI